MSIEQWGAVGEIIGGIGVIATLIYLAIQIRANTKATRGATESAILRYGREITSAPFGDKESAELFLRGASNFDSLDEIERSMFTNRIGPYFLFWYDAHIQYRNGLISTELWDTFEKDIPGLFMSPGTHEVWELLRNSFPIEFQQYVDDLAEKDPSESPDYLAIRKKDT